MYSAKRALLVAICVAFLFIPQNQARAQDDETPEQQRMMQTLAERQKIADTERSGAANYVSPEEQLMREKESDRASMIREEERDATEESEGRWQYWHH